MFKMIMTTILAGTLVLTTLGIASVQAQTDKQTVKIRTKVYKYGIGKKVSVKTQDKTKFKGAITKIEKDTFTVSSKSGSKRTFSYSEVAKVSKTGLGKGSWIAIGAAAAVGVIVAVVWVKACRNGEVLPC